MAGCNLRLLLLPIVDFFLEDDDDDPMDIFHGMVL